MLDRREALATTVVGLGAWLTGYVGRCFEWYWNSVLVPEPLREQELFIHQGNIGINTDYYITMVIKPDGIWMRVNGQLIPYEEWLEKDVYVRARAPMTKGEYRLEK